MNLKAILISILSLAVLPAFPQAHVPSAAEDSLYMLFQKFRVSRDAEDMQARNHNIIDYMSEVLRAPESFDYRFDSLKKVAGILESPDGLFRIYTWNVPLNFYEHEIHGIIQVNNPGKDSCEIHILENQLDAIQDVLHAETDKSHWPGALYYEMRRNKSGKQVFYTLMGYNFHDRWSDKKIIEVLHFDEELNPRFGKPVFDSPEGLQHRVIFEYSGEVAMNLRYNPDLKMIVYDHLSPIEPELAAHPRFYAPDFSYDGYKFRRGVWGHRSDVDVRNR
jgi:hypothetical protein